MLMNTGKKPVFSKHGLVTTVAFKIGKEEPIFALEVFSHFNFYQGSVAIAGAAIRWLRDNMKMINSSDEICFN